MLKRLSLFLVLIISGCTQYLFVPLRQQYITPDVVGILHEDIYLETDDGVRLHGWKLIAADNSGGTILFLHGNGDNVSTHFANAYWLVDEGYDVYLFDYRQYGLSEGEVTLDNATSDSRKMIAYSVNHLAKNEKLIVMGHSLGGAIAIYAVAHSAYRNRIRALVTIEAFSDYHDVTRDVLAKSWLLWPLQWPLSFTIDNSYRPLDAIGLVAPVPVCIIHSKSDEMIDFYHAQKLYDAAKPPKTLLLINSEHNNIFNKKENRQVLLDYLSGLKPASAPHKQPPAEKTPDCYY